MATSTKDTVKKRATRLGGGLAIVLQQPSMEYILEGFLDFAYYISNKFA